MSTRTRTMVCDPDPRRAPADDGAYGRVRKVWRWPRALLFASVSLALLMAVTPGRAGVDNWTAGRQPGGQVRTAALAGDICYAAPVVGLFRSTAGCQTWRRVSGLNNYAVRGIAIDPLSSATAYAATDNGMWRTANSGAAWHRITGGVPDVLSFRAVAAALGQTGGALFASDKAVWRTTSSGEDDWVRLDSGIPAGGFDGVLIEGDGTAWAWDFLDGMFELATDSATWAPMNDGLGFHLISDVAMTANGPVAATQGGPVPFRRAHVDLEGHRGRFAC